MREFEDKIDWKLITIFQQLSENFIRENKSRIYWDYVASYHKLSEDFITEFQDRLNWDEISIYQKLSEDFIRRFKNKLNWKYVSIYQILSEDFIREFKNNLNFYYIINSQKLSEDFLKEFNFYEVKKLTGSKEHKINKLMSNGFTVVNDDYIYAYMPTCKNGKSLRSLEIFKEGQVYTSSCPIIPTEKFVGLKVYPKIKNIDVVMMGKNYIFKVKIYIDDVFFVDEDEVNLYSSYDFEVYAKYNYAIVSKLETLYQFEEKNMTYERIYGSNKTISFSAILYLILILFIGYLFVQFF
jgi:hypothetical protein